MSAVMAPTERSQRARVPRTGPPHEIKVVDGPALLAHLDDGPSLAAHRRRFGPCPSTGLDALIASTAAVDVRGRGGAGFPFSVKLATAARRRRRVLAVNLAEGEPASAKDSALAIFVPHRILDGVACVAGALGVHEVHVVVAGDRPAVGEAITRALAERRQAGERLRWRMHRASPTFVAGQARAVLELMAGRENLPVTAWTPEAVSGHKGRPTLLSNGETWAQVGALVRMGPEDYRRHGTAEEPGTTLLSFRGDHQDPEVVEVRNGTPWSALLTAEQLARPVLLGGYHGTWAAPGELTDAVVSRSGLAALGLALGAGVVLPLPPGRCPLTRTSEIVTYLAGQSARRCGPCLNGLPELAGALTRVAGIQGSFDDLGAARGARERVEELLGLVNGRGACAHPDGTVRLVRSVFRAVPHEALRHAAGTCDFVPVDSQPGSTT
ncbi:MAG: NADH-ubiquinone oxidoreductase-F iron-sulfur binding region domain-containing protein [Lapillicoccus sp.]